MSEVDALDWALDRMRWDRSVPPDFEYDHNIAAHPPIRDISERVIKQLLKHLTLVADYDGLVVAMEETEACMADQREAERRYSMTADENYAVYLALLAHDCRICGATSGHHCTSRSGKRTTNLHARRGSVE